ncbi:MAG: hypothetical protein P9M14_15405 [Candidatus Alcyoniella australis]|nr:hypothetical protein [Candidatus Alcyoniella australis]
MSRSGALLLVLALALSIALCCAAWAQEGQAPEPQPTAESVAAQPTAQPEATAEPLPEPASDQTDMLGEPLEPTEQTEQVEIEGFVDRSVDPSLRRPYYPLLVILVFSLMTILPFISGMIEVLNPRDEYPLPVKMSYSKDPRYLGKSARRIFVKALGERINEEGMQKVRMSKEELVEVSRSKHVPAGEQIEHAMYVPGDLVAKEKINFEKDIYVTGDATVGPESRLRAIACDGRLELGANCRISRWADCEQQVQIGEGCVLGISCSSLNEIHLGDKIVFRRLYGYKITTPDYHNSEPHLETRSPQRERIDPMNIKTIKDVATVLDGDISIASAADIDHDLIVRGDLAFGEKVMMRGSARAYGFIEVGKGTVVLGDLFAEGPIKLCQGAEVLGHVFSQESVVAEEGARMGAAGTIKSVIGKKAITLGKNVAAHGYVLTEGKGIVRCEESS